VVPLSGWVGGSIGGEVETGLHLRSIKELIVSAAHHIGELCQIRHERPIAILPIQADDGALAWETLRIQIALDGCHRAAQFSTVIAVACAAERPQPLVRMRLQHRRARPNDLPAFASGVARLTDSAQAAMGSRTIGRFW